MIFAIKFVTRPHHRRHVKLSIKPSALVNIPTALSAEQFKITNIHCFDILLFVTYLFISAHRKRLTKSENQRAITTLIATKNYILYVINNIHLPFLKTY